MEEAFSWDLMRDGYLETGIEHLESWWNPLINVKDAKCQPNNPKSFFEFFRSVYIEARYDRPHLPFRTHSYFSAFIICSIVLCGVLTEAFLSSYNFYSGQILLTFLFFFL